MKRTLSMLVFAFAIFAAVPSPSEAAPNRSTAQAGGPGKGGPFGLGIMVGEPTGLSAKYWMSGSAALAFGLTYSLHDYFGLFIDHDWHFPAAFGGNVPLVPYIGLGGGLYFDTYNRYYGENYRFRGRAFNGYASSPFSLGVRIPLGLEFLPRSAPLGAFLEVVPEVAIFPGIYGILQAAIGMRYYF